MLSCNVYKLLISPQQSLLAKQAASVLKITQPCRYYAKWYDSVDKAKKTISENWDVLKKGNSKKNRALINDAKKTATSTVDEVSKSLKNEANNTIDTTSEKIKNRIASPLEDWKSKMFKN